MPRVSKKQIEEDQVLVRSTTPAFVAGVIVVGILVVGGAIMIGRSDNGEIDVASTINQANITNAENGTGEQVNPTNPVFQNMPNGGLIPKGEQPSEPPVAEEPANEILPEPIATTSTPTEGETQPVSETNNTATTEESTP